MDEKEIQGLKQELEDIKTVLLLELPFFASLLRKCRIVLDERTNRMLVNSLGEMRIDPKFFKPLPKKEKIFLYCHETAHIALGHLQRMGDRNQKLFNIATDALINCILMRHGFKNIEIPDGIVLPPQLFNIIFKTEEEIVQMSAEEIYYLLEKNAQETPPLNFINDLSKSSDENPSDKTIILQEGDPRAYESKNPEKIEKYWKDAIIKAAIQSRMAGKQAGDLERFIDEIWKSRVKWKELIKKEIVNSLGKITISDWNKTSRRYKLLPGTKRISLPNIWFLVDTSASIRPNDLKQFFSEVYSILKNHAKGIIVPWDTKIYPLIKLNKARDIGIPMQRTFGGGGTMIYSALNETLKLMKLGDMVIVLTDGEIFDFDQPKTQELFKKVGQKSINSIFATIQTQKELPLKWKKIKIALESCREQ